MARALPPLTWFRAFEGAARHLSFTAAAQELGLTQSAVSQHVRSLELRFQTALFVRKPRGLALTDAGRRLLPDVTAAMERLAGAAQTFETPAPAGTLTVAASVSFAQWFFVPGMRSFLDANPDIRIRLVTTIWPDDFAASTADVEVRFGAAAHVGHDAERLGPDRMVAVRAPENDAPSDWEALRHHRLIQAVGTSDTWLRWATHNRLPPPDTIAVQADSHGLSVDLAQAGVGVALTSVLLAAPGLADGRLVRAHDADAPATDGYFLAISKDADAARAARFTVWMKERIEDRVRRAEGR